MTNWLKNNGLALATMLAVVFGQYAVMQYRMTAVEARNQELERQIRTIADEVNRLPDRDMIQRLEKDLDTLNGRLYELNRQRQR